MCGASWSIRTSRLWATYARMEIYQNVTKNQLVVIGKLFMIRHSLLILIMISGSLVRSATHWKAMLRRMHRSFQNLLLMWMTWRRLNSIQCVIKQWLASFKIRAMNLLLKNIEFNACSQRKTGTICMRSRFQVWICHPQVRRFNLILNKNTIMVSTKRIIQQLQKRLYCRPTKDHK